jgi:hypothetical protein
VTRLPAKYFDPVTRLPYANLQAFRVLREAYYTQLEAKGDRSDPEVAAWIDWRQKNKPSKPSYLPQVNRAPATFAGRAAIAVSSQSPQLPTTPHPRQPPTQSAATASAAVAAAVSSHIVLPVRTTPLNRGAIHQLLNIILQLRILVLLFVSTLPYVVKVKNYS